MLTPQRISAREGESLQRRAAGALLARGLAPAERVVIVARTSPAMFSAVLGALRVGIVPVLLSPELLAEEQEGLIGDADPSLILRDDDVERLVSEGRPADLAPFPLSRPMHFTSGTTGRPKAVWSGMFDEASARGLIMEERELWGFDSSDANLVCSPLHHSAPLRFAMGTLLAGGDVILLPRFDAETVVDVLATQAPTSMFCVPTHLQRIFALGSIPEVSSLRLVAHAGAPISKPLKLRAIEEFPKDTVWEFYGSTEGQFTNCSSSEWLEHPGTVGRARPYRSLSIDDDGIIWCEVPSYARFEYWRDPEKTRAAWRNGSFTVGDIGRLDDGGYLFLDGRRDDLIITGGVNVYPMEVELVIQQLDGVTSAAVFGVDDEQWGQRVCAAVVGNVTAREVTAHCRAHLAGFKRPKDVYIVEELPFTPTGKIRRSTLAEDLGLIKATA